MKKRFKNFIIYTICLATMLSMIGCSNVPKDTENGIKVNKEYTTDVVVVGGGGSGVTAAIAAA